MTRSSTFSKLEHIDWASWQAQDLATLLFIVQENRILLIRKLRGLGAGKINGPGGRLEPGETPTQAAIREVEEELLVTPMNVRACGELLFQFVDGFSIHGYVFKADDCSGEPQETDEAIPLWTSLEDIPYDRMWADDRVWVPMMLRGTSFKGRFVFEDDTMLDHEVVVTS